MMGCANQAETMSLYEYEERVYHWNEAHSTEDKVSPPDADKMQRLLDAANSDPRLTN